MRYNMPYGRHLLRLKLASLADRLSIAIKQSGLKYRKIAAEMGCGESMIALIATKRRTVRACDIAKFAKVVGCDLEWLLKGGEWDGQG